MTELDDQALMREWFRFFGATTGARLLGWCALTGLVMPSSIEPSRESLLAHGYGSVSTRYRNVHQLEAFAASVRARGLTLPEEPPPSPAVPLLRAFS